jgi:hypothetical protein
MDLKTIIIILMTIFILQIIFQIYAITDLVKRKHFKYFNRLTWAFIIIFGNIIGTILYIILKGND